MVVAGWLVALLPTTASIESNLPPMAVGLWRHYVPQMYLRGFLNPTEVAKGQNVLWRYKAGFHPRRMATTSVAAASGFYFAPELIGAENETEALGKLAC